MAARWSSWTSWLGLVPVVCIVVAALYTGATHRHYDVDELQHAHVTWLISQGDRPFHDFVESHSPFVWLMAAPLIGPAPTPEQALTAWRLSALAFGLLFVGLVGACVRARQPAIPIPWIAAASLLALAHPRTMDFFIEARPDSLSYCVLFGAVLLFLHDKPAPLFARCMTFAFLASTSVLWNQKLALFVVLFAALDLLMNRRGAFAQTIAGHAAGIVLAATVALAVLAAAGIDPVLAYQLSIGFHQRFLAQTAFQAGLLSSLSAQPVQLVVFGIGLLSWLGLTLTRRMRVRPFELAVAGFLLCSVVIVPLPYKQYFAPWFVLAAVFLPSLGVLLERGPRMLSPIALIALLVGVGVSAWGAGVAYGARDQRAFMHHLWTTVRAATRPDARVIVHPTMHPIQRRDVFYAWFSTWDPAGNDQETIMQAWNPLGQGVRFSREGYRAEIEANPPDLLLHTGKGWDLPRVQNRVVDEWMRAHQGEYQSITIAGQVRVLVRRETANWEDLRRLGHWPGGP